MTETRGHRKLILFTVAFFFSASFCCTNFCCADEPRPVLPNSIDWLTEYATARRAGIKKDRLVLLFVTSENCGYCVKMRNETLTDDTIVADLKEKFVPAKLHLKMDDELAQQLHVKIYPTTMIISPQGRILDYARGYLTSTELQQRMNEALVQQDSVASNP